MPTVRSALKVLIERGLLYNLQGSGTYVAERTDATYIPRRRQRCAGGRFDARRRRRLFARPHRARPHGG